jgi:RNA polymerase sigma-70 factor, ECF subfamily
MPDGSGQTVDSLIDLLAKVSRHDRDAFAALYQATSRKLFGVVVRILNRKQVAEDVLQDVYVRIWEKAGDFNPSLGSPIAWMATIARNRALDEARRRPYVISSEEVSGFEDMASPERNAAEELELTEDYNRLYRCLENLEDEKRAMVLLAYQSGLSREMLAQRFNKPVATVKTWLRRSLEALKKCLDQ